MIGSRVLRIARADFRERVRTRRFLAVVVAVAYVGSAVTRGTIKLSFQGGYGPVKGAEWLGTTTAMTAAFLSLLAGFYVSRGGIATDREHGLGPGIAASPVRDGEYVLGKWVSGVAVQWVLFVLLLFAAVVTGLVVDAGGFSLRSLVAPSLVLAFPVALPVAAVAVCFETNRYLDGTGGTAAYTLGAFFVLSAVPILALLGSPPAWVMGFDLIGFAPVVESMREALVAQYPDYEGMPSFGVGGAPVERTFAWGGVEWTPSLLAARAAIAAAAAPVLALAAFSFDRFGTRSAGTGARGTDATDEDAPAGTGDASLPSVTFERDAETGVRWVRLLRSELRLALAERSRAWRVGALGLAVAGLVVPAATARDLLLPVAAVWPLPVWAQLGVRARRNHVRPFVRSSNAPVAKVIAEWGSGALVTLGVLAGVGVRLAATGRPGLAVGPIAAAVCFPAVALALGTASGSPRPFEGALLVTWYAGTLNGFPPLDVLATTDRALRLGTPFVALAVGGLVLAATVAVEARRVGRLSAVG